MFALLAALALQSAAVPPKTWPTHEGDFVIIQKCYR